jgi:hypothetical protein
LILTSAGAYEKGDQMKITIESTEMITSLEIRHGQHGISMPARIWEGFTESGIPVHCFVTRIAATVEDKPENATLFREFEQELKEQRKPSVEVATIPLRLIL